MRYHLGIKSDPIATRYTFPWLFRLMAEEGVTQLQLGTFFELYSLPDSYFVKLRKQAADHGITIASVFTAHRELGGFFREDEEWIPAARRSYERLIEVAALLGASSAGSNPGSVPRDLMGTKSDGVRRYMEHFKQLMHVAHDRGLSWLTIEPMSCLAEPPTLPEEIAAWGEELTAYHNAHASSTARPGYCTDIAHGYLDAQGKLGFDHVQLFEATLPWLYEIHLKNTDQRFNSTFGFEPESLSKGIVDVAQFRRLLDEHAATIPVEELGCYLEIGGPKVGRDYTDGGLEHQLRGSIRYLRDHFLQESANPAPSAASAGKGLPPRIGTGTAIQVGPSMMCVDPLNFESALRRVEALGVDYLHLDVMDGRFVPNLPMGLGIIQALPARTALPLDVHLMVQEPAEFLALLGTTPVASISVHAEAATHLDRTLDSIRSRGSRAGLALNPSTPLAVLDYVLERLDYVLLMTVNPGFAGQQLTPASIRKIRDCRAYLQARGYGHLPIQVDGNVSFANIPLMVAAGATSLVAGTSSLFHSSASWSENMTKLRDAIASGCKQQES